MEVGVNVWVLNPDSQDDEVVWLPGEITNKEVQSSHSFNVKIKALERVHEQLTVVSENGELPHVHLRKDGEDVEDLIRLTFLHEPAILHTLQMRFEKSLIYTYTGPILIAVNPFQILDLYTDDILQAHYESGVARSQGFESPPLPPHVYAIAANAYQDMSLRLAKLRASRKGNPVKDRKPAALPSMYARSASSASESKPEDAISQSILISGESGSGKTVSTKHCLEYLTTVGRAADDRSKGLKLAAMQRDTGSNKIVQSNPILEAFGNACTLRNDNSSRFGKLVQLHFGIEGGILGGSISSYLLEKVRITRQTVGERNFHIFYQLCAAAEKSPQAPSSSSRASSSPMEAPARRRSSIGAINRRESWNGGIPANATSFSQETTSELAMESKWNLRSADNYFYANQGEVYDLRNVDDGQEHQNLRYAMHVLGFTPGEISQSLNVAASLLHLGEISFIEGEKYESLFDGEKASSAAQVFSELVGVDFEALKKAITVKDVSTKWDTVLKDLRPVDACNARDTLATSLYSRLFNWLVEKVNAYLKVQTSAQIEASVSVLDIFGFECFKVNSLEQLCINYTNEKLQQHFNNYVFKLEEAEYTREGIEWSLIDFPDNTDILDMIEGKSPMGILALLDDECNNPNGNDKNFTQRIYSAFLGDETQSKSQAVQGKKNDTSNSAQSGFSLLNVRTSSGGAEGITGGKHPRFDVTKLMKPLGQFSINHYAGPVTYSPEGFWSKNRDEIPPEVVKLFRGSLNSFISSLFAEDDGETLNLGGGQPRSSAAASLFNPTSKQASAKNRRMSMAGKQAFRTIAMKFKTQLADLMERLSVTQPHYIRCLKPNEVAEPFLYNQRHIGEQLRYGGVLEAVRVSRSGFPVRMTHGEFYEHYRRLVSGVAASTEGKAKLAPRSKSPIGQSNEEELPLTLSQCTPDKVESYTKALTKSVAASTVASPEEEYDPAALQFGLTKVFLRKKAHDALEVRLVSRRRRSSIRLQAFSRSSLALEEYRKTLQSVHILNRCFRMVGSRAKFVQKRRAAIVLQCLHRKTMAVILKNRLAVEMKDVNLQRAKMQERQAKIAEEKLEAERREAERQAKIAEEMLEAKRREAERQEDEKRQAAEAAAAASKKDSVQRVVQRTVDRFAYTVPVTFAVKKWVRYTKWAIKEAQAQIAAEAAKASADKLAALEDELLAERTALKAERAKTKAAEEELEMKTQELEKSATRERAKSEEERAALDTKLKRVSAQLASLEEELQSERDWRKSDKAKFQAKEEDLEERLSRAEAAGAQERSKAESSHEELEAKVQRLERAASRDQAEREEVQADAEARADQVAALQKELAEEREERQAEKAQFRATEEDFEERLSQMEALSAKKCEELTAEINSAKEAYDELLQSTTQKEEVQLQSGAMKEKAVNDLRKEVGGATLRRAAFRWFRSVPLAAAMKQWIRSTKLAADEAHAARFAATSTDMQSIVAALEEKCTNLTAEINSAQEAYDELLVSTTQKEEAQLQSGAMKEKAVNDLRKEVGGATLRRAAFRWFRSVPLAAAMKKWIRSTKLAADEAHAARFAATSTDMQSIVAALEDELLKERSERRAERAHAESVKDDLEAKIIQIERAATRERSERSDEMSEAETAKVESQKKAARLQDDLEEAQAKVQALEKMLSQERDERQEQHDTHISMAATAAHAAQKTIKELSDEASAAKSALESAKVAHASLLEETERDNVARIAFLERSLDSEREDRQQVEASLKSTSEAAAERAKTTIEELRTELSDVQEALTRETNARAADRSADDIRLDSNKVAMEILNAQVAALEETLTLERAEMDSERAASQNEFDNTVATHEAALSALREELEKEMAARAADVAEGDSTAAKLREELLESAKEVKQKEAELSAAVAAASELELQLKREQDERAGDGQAHADALAAVETHTQDLAEKHRAEVNALVDAANSDRAKQASDRLALEAACQDKVDDLHQQMRDLEATLAETEDASERETRRANKLSSSVEALQYEIDALGEQLATQVSGRAAESAQASASLTEAQAKMHDLSANLDLVKRQRTDEHERHRAMQQSADELKRSLSSQLKELETSRAEWQSEASAAKRQLEALQVQALVVEEKLARETEGRRKDKVAQTEALAAVETRAKTMTEELQLQVTGLIEATRRERAGRSAQAARGGAQAGAIVAVGSGTAEASSLQIAALEDALAREREKLTDALAAQTNAEADARAANARAREASYAAQAGDQAVALSEALEECRAELRSLRSERDALARELDAGAAQWQAQGLAAAASSYRPPRSLTSTNSPTSPRSPRSPTSLHSPTGPGDVGYQFGGSSHGEAAALPSSSAVMTAARNDLLNHNSARGASSPPPPLPHEGSAGGSSPPSRGLQQALVSLVEKAEADATALRGDVTRLEAELAGAQVQVEALQQAQAQSAAATAREGGGAGRGQSSRATSPVAFAELTQEDYQGLFGGAPPPLPQLREAPTEQQQQQVQQQQQQQRELEALLHASEQKQRKLELELDSARAQVKSLSDSAEVEAMREQLQAAAGTFERILLAAEQEHRSEAGELREAVEQLKQGQLDSEALVLEQQQHRSELSALRGLVAKQDADAAQQRGEWDSEREVLEEAVSQAHAERDRTAAEAQRTERRLVQEKETEVANALGWFREEQRAKEALELELAHCEASLQHEQNERASLEDMVASSLQQFYTAATHNNGSLGGTKSVGSGSRSSNGITGSNFRGSVPSSNRSATGAFQTPPQTNRFGLHLTPSSRNGGGGVSGGSAVSGSVGGTGPSSAGHTASKRLANSYRSAPPRSASAPRMAPPAGSPLLERQLNHYRQQQQQQQQQQQRPSSYAPDVAPSTLRAGREMEPRPVSPHRSPLLRSPRSTTPTVTPQQHQRQPEPTRHAPLNGFSVGAPSTRARRDYRA